MRSTVLIRRVLTVAAVSASVLAGTAAVTTTAHAAAGCTPYAQGFQSANDFNGDGYPDAAYGEPSRRVAAKFTAGAVRVVPSCGPEQLLTAASFGLVPTPGARLGATLNAARIDSDLYTDLVVSAPGQNKAGVVWIVFGSAAGLNRGKPAQRITVAGLHSGDRFGASVDLITNYIDSRGHEDLRWNLVIGAPGTKVGKATDAGAAYRIVFKKNSTDVATRTRWVQGSPGFPGKPEKGDQFGETLADASAQYRGSPIYGVRVVAVGVPHEDVGKAKDAGAVYLVAGLGLNRATALSRATAHVPGTAGVGDRFGHALVGLSTWVYVGAPGDDVGAAKNAGSIQRIVIGPEGKPAVSSVRTQDTKGVSGVAEKDDALGSSLAWVAGDFESDGPDVAAGAPGESVDGHKAAGAVTFFNFSAGCASGGCATITQNTARSPHSAETGDRFGASLSTIGDGFYEELASYGPVIGVPGEDIGSVTNAGAFAGDTGYMPIDRGSASGEALGEVAPSLLEVW